jgi:transposase
MYYIGLDVHKKTISYCVKDAAGCVHREGKELARHGANWTHGSEPFPNPAPSRWKRRFSRAGSTIICCRTPSAVKVAHPLMLRAIAAEAEERQDRRRQDRRLPALRLPAGVPHGFDRDPEPAPDPALSGTGAEADAVQMKNRVSGLLMETGVSYNKLRLHRMGYFAEADVDQRRGQTASGRCSSSAARPHRPGDQKLDTALVHRWSRIRC